MDENTNKTEQLTCNICNDYKCDSPQKLGLHKHHCAKRNPDSIPKQEDVSPEVDTRNPREERVPFGEQETRLPSGPSDDGYYYRVFNDNWRKEPGRVSRALRAGFEAVDVPSSGMTVGTNEDGSEIKGVLMRIPSELHDQDMAAKEEKLLEVDKQIYSGRYQKSKGDGRYIPSEGISISNKTTP